MDRDERIAGSLVAAGRLSQDQAREALSRRAGDPQLTWSDILGDDELGLGPWADEAAAGAASEPPRLVREHDGRYEPLEQIGRGGMGTVRLVYDRATWRCVARKELLCASSTGDGAQRVARFLREARVTAQLDHPGIVAVHEVGSTSDGEPYYTMPHLRGETLSEALARADGLVARLGLLDHFTDLCHAVAYAHAKGVCHRDLKPENVMIGRFGQTILMDWGLARLTGERVSLPGRETVALTSEDSLQTRAGAVLGTPHYMSPEQASGAAATVGPASDVWSLGVMLYQILTGRLPFGPGTPPQILEQVRSSQPLPVLALEPEAPRDLAAVVHKALSRDPSQRYPHAGALAEDLDAWRQGLQVRAHSYTTAELLRRFVARHRGVLTAVGVALVAVAVLGSVAVVNVVQERDFARRAEAAAGQALAEARVEALLATAAAAELRGQPDQAALALAAAEEYSLPEEHHRLRTEQRRLQALATPSRVFRRPDGSLRALDVSPVDGAVWTGGVDGRILRWSPTGREPAQVMFEAPGEIGGMLMSADGLRLVVVSADEDGRGGVVSVLDTGSGQRLSSWAAPRPSWDYAALSRDGGTLATRYGRADGLVFGPSELVLWDTAAGRRVSTPGIERAFALAFVSDGELLATLAGRRPGVDIWSTTDGARVLHLDSAANLRGLAASDDGARLLATDRERLVQEWSLPDGARRPDRSFPWSGRASTVLLEPDRGVVAAVDAEDMVRAWKLDDGTLLAVGQAPDRWGVPLALSPRGRWLAAPGLGGSVLLLDLLSGAGRNLLGQQGQIGALGFPPDERTLVSASFLGEIRAWDLQGRLDPPDREGRGEPITVMRVEGERVVTGHHGGAVRWGDVVVEAGEYAGWTGWIACDIQTDPAGRVDVVWSSRCRTSADVSYTYSNAGEQRLRLARLGPDGEVLRHASIPGESLGGVIELAPGGGRVAVARTDGCVVVLDLDRPDEPVELCGGGAIATDLSWSPTGDLLAVGGQSGTALWDVGNARLVDMLRDAEGSSRLAWSPDGGLLATVDGRGAIHLWTAADGAESAGVEGLSPPSGIVSWSPSGSWLAAGNETGEVRIWSSEGRLVHELASPGGGVTQITFSRAGDRAAVGYWGGEVRVFDLDGGGLLRTISTGADTVLALGWSQDDRSVVIGTSSTAEVLRVAAPPLDGEHVRADTLDLTNLRICRRGLAMVPVADPSPDSPWAPAEACQAP